MAETLKEEATRLLANVPEEYVFWSCDGHVLRNLKELEGELKTMSGESYTFHANPEKNDFTNWVRDIIKDEKLAGELQKALSQQQAVRAVNRRLTTLSRRLVRA